MAGIGGYPPVIELPKDTRWEELGKGLGNIAGGIFDAWNTSDTMKKAQQQWPTNSIEDLNHKMIYMQSRLGEKGGKFISQQMDLMKAQATIEESKAAVSRDMAAIHSAQILDQLHAVQAKNQDAIDQANIREMNARSAASRASAAGEGARATLELTEAARYRQEMDLARQRQEAAQRSQGLIMQILKERTGGGTSATPTPTPQSYEVPGGGGESIQAPIRPISTGDIIPPTAGGTGAPAGVVGPATTAGATETSGQRTVRLLKAQSDVESGKDLTRDMAPPPYSPALLGEVLSYTGEATPEGQAKAFAALQKGDVPSKTEYQDLIPGSGIQIQMGMYSDGKWHAVPGAQPKITLKDISEVGKRAGQGAVLWNTTSQVLKLLGNTNFGPEAKAGDVFGDRLIRSLNQRLISHGFNPIGSDAAATTAFDTIRQHSIVGITSLLSGMRQTNDLRNQVQATMPTLSDTAELRNAKLRATELTADLVIKEEVESAAGSEKVDPGLRDIYMAKRLWDKDINQLQREYVDSIQALGLSPIDVQPKGGSDTDDTTTAAPATSAPPPARRDSGAGWSIQRHPD